MGRKLRTRLPTLPKQHIPEGNVAKKLKETDRTIKEKQKQGFYRRHRTRPQLELKKGDRVWIKTPHDKEVVVVSQAPSPSSPPSHNSRSYFLQTNNRTQRRNRVHLRNRDNTQQMNKPLSPPKATSNLREHQQRLAHPR